ncbi:MAG: AbiV family abortive infection protein [Bacteroidota bacterium]
MKLKSAELLQLFSNSIDNAFELYNAAQHLTISYDGKKYPALGLAELALEELGKSYTCLAYYSKANKINDWTVFWKEWKDHDLKAHRAFFYEFFCLLRVELINQKFTDKFPTLREKFSKEKELSFYVDINKSNRKIHIPEREIEDIECINRIASLIGLINSTFHIRDWLNSDNSEYFKNAISDYAFVTITKKMYQQDVENVLKGMRTDNEEYNRGLDNIWALFKPDKTKDKGLNGIMKIIEQKNKDKK